MVKCRRTFRELNLKLLIYFQRRERKNSFSCVHVLHETSLGTLSNFDDDASQNVTEKSEFASFQT